MKNVWKRLLLKLETNCLLKLLDWINYQVLIHLLAELTFLALMRNSFGNYVVQKAINISEGTMKEELANAIKSNIEHLAEKKLKSKWKQILEQSLFPEPGNPLKREDLSLSSPQMSSNYYSPQAPYYNEGVGSPQRNIYQSPSPGASANTSTNYGLKSIEKLSENRRSGGERDLEIGSWENSMEGKVSTRSGDNSGGLQGSEIQAQQHQPPYSFFSLQSMNSQSPHQPTQASHELHHTQHPSTQTPGQTHETEQERAQQHFQINMQQVSLQERREGAEIEEFCIGNTGAGQGSLIQNQNNQHSQINNALSNPVNNSVRDVRDGQNATQFYNLTSFSSPR